MSRTVAARPVRGAPASWPATTGEAAGLVARPPVLWPPRVHLEEFRLLGLNVLRMLEQQRSRSLLVMSAGSDEGRSSAVCGMARAIAAVSGPVVVVGADPDWRGLEELAPERVDALWRPGETEEPPPLQVVAPWLRPGSGADVLETTHRFVGEAVASGATVVVDAPAVTESSLGFYLATTVSGILYVVRPRVVRERAVHVEIRSQLDLLGARVLGIVVNEW